jgi:hypothetical protein
MIKTKYAGIAKYDKIGSPTILLNIEVKIGKSIIVHPITIRIPWSSIAQIETPMYAIKDKTPFSEKNNFPFVVKAHCGLCIGCNLSIL